MPIIFKETHEHPAFQIKPNLDDEIILISNHVKSQKILLMRIEQNLAHLQKNNTQVKHIEKNIQSLYVGHKLKAFLAILVSSFSFFWNGRNFCTY